MLLSTVDPELERSLESVAAKAIAKVRAKSSAGKVCESSLQLLQLQPLAAPAAGSVWRFQMHIRPLTVHVFMPVNFNMQQTVLLLQLKFVIHF